MRLVKNRKGIFLKPFKFLIVARVNYLINFNLYLEPAKYYLTRLANDVT